MVKAPRPTLSPAPLPEGEGRFEAPAAHRSDGKVIQIKEVSRG
ncbi:MAG: hypothetical protein AMXMBFR72_30160 [Betaproteobacteria bacterium]|nr:MAG: hypothetical protein BroJett031_36200 [Betaproteobacteria bacterium]